MQYAMSDYVSFLPGVSHSGLRVIPLENDPDSAHAGDDGAGIEFAVVDAGTDAGAGRVGIRRPPDRPETIRISYRTVKGSGRSDGHAGLVRSIVDTAIAQRLERAELRCAVDDAGAVKAALGAGLRYEGVQRLTRQEGPPGEAVFARLASDPSGAIGQALPDLPKDDLTDGVISLRIASAEDAPALYAESSNPEARRWALAEALPESVITENAARAGLHWLVGPQGLLVIVDRASGRVAGRLVLRSVVPPNVADVGYGVIPEFRGRGFSSRALKLICPWAFEVAGYARLELGIKPENRASLSAAMKAGFSPDSTRAMRLRNSDGSFADEIHFAAVNPKYSQPSLWTPAGFHAPDRIPSGR